MSRVIELAQHSNWAIVPEKLDAIHDVLAGWHDKLTDRSDWTDASDQPDAPYETLPGHVAVISVRGVLAKRVNLMQQFSGGTSMELLGRDFQAALDDPDVRAIVLDVDSPGGTVDGTEALASRIFAARDVKPIVAHVDGMMASAAYWIGSAAHILINGPTSDVGSIGVLQAHYDYSEADKKAGVKRTYIYAGRYKTAGNDAEPLDEDSREYLQAGIDYVYSMFVNTVARHRGMTIAQALAMAEGRIFIGEQARDIGLTDRVGSWETALEIAQDMGLKTYLFGKIPDKEEYIMSETNRPITLDRLEAEAPELVGKIRDAAAAAVDMEPARAEGAASERDRILGLAEVQFGEEQAARLKGLVDSAITVDQFKAVRALDPTPAVEKIEPKTEKMDEMLTAIQAAGAANPGADSAPGGPVSFTAAWQGIKTEKGCSAEQAMKEAVRTYPDLHAAFLNGQHTPAGRA